MGRLIRKTARLDQPPAEGRSDGARDGRQRGPHADGAAAFLRREGGAEHREARGHEQRGPNSLHGPRGDEGNRTGRESATERSDGERRRADGEESLPAEAVSERASDENQRGEKQRVGLHDPLGAGNADAQVLLEHRQRHAHDGPVDERHARAEDGRGENPPTRRRRAGLRIRRKGDATRAGIRGEGHQEDSDTFFRALAAHHPFLRRGG
jgi:hypothetical protein